VTDGLAEPLRLEDPTTIVRGARNGDRGYALMRHLPRRLLNAVVRRRVARVRLPAS
jgi:hypothetical protein